MQSPPPLPALGDAPPALLERGHLWLRELLVGRRIRFRMAPSGLLAVADGDRVHDEGSVPLPLRHTVDHLAARFDRDSLREAATDPSAVVFVGVATLGDGVDYDRDRLPPFLGTDVWSADREGFLPVDAAERALDRLGLSAVNTVDREVNTRDFHPERYTFPDSAWYDGSVPGVVVRNRNGTAGRLDNPEWVASVTPATGTPAELAREHVTADRLRRVERLLDGSRTAPLDTLTEGTFACLVHEMYRPLVAGEVDLDSLERAVGERVRALRG